MCLVPTFSPISNEQSHVLASSVNPCVARPRALPRIRGHAVSSRDSAAARLTPHRTAELLYRTLMLFSLNAS